MKTFRHELPIYLDTKNEIGGETEHHHEWWTIGLDFIPAGERVDFFVSHGGIKTTEAPIAVMIAAVSKWTEWLKTL